MTNSELKDDDTATLPFRAQEWDFRIRQLFDEYSIKGRPKKKNVFYDEYYQGG